MVVVCGVAHSREDINNGVIFHFMKPILFFISNILMNYLVDVLFGFLIRCYQSCLSILVIKLLV